MNEPLRRHPQIHFSDLQTMACTGGNFYKWSHIFRKIDGLDLQLYYKYNSIADVHLQISEICLQRPSQHFLRRLGMFGKIFPCNIKTGGK